MAERKTIRVGLIRCDTHGYYFGAQMDAKHLVPEKLVEYEYIVAQYYQDIYNPFKLDKLPTVSGFEIVKCYDYQRERAERFSETFSGRPRVCETVEEMAEGIDAVLISDCDGGGRERFQRQRRHPLGPGRRLRAPLRRGRDTQEGQEDGAQWRAPGAL